MSDNNLVKNIFFQAKRTSKIIDVPLTKAKDLIARAIYQCHDFNDLCCKVENNSLKASVYPYCKIHPKADEESKRYVEKNIEILAERFSRYLTVQLSPVPLLYLILTIFGIHNRASLMYVLPHIELDNWQPYMPVAKDYEGVTYLDIKINNVPFKMLATRVVTVHMFADNSLNELLVLNDELSKYQYVPIMWQDFHKWQEAVFIYFNSVGSKKAPRKPSFATLVEPKSVHQKAFQDTLYESMQALSEEFIGTSVRYCDINREVYYVIGFTMFDDIDSNNCPDFYLTKEHIQNGKCIFGIGENILALELFEVNEEGDYIGEAKDYYNALGYSLRQFEESMTKFIMIDGRRYDAFIRPCTDAEHERYITSSVTLVEN